MITITFELQRMQLSQQFQLWNWIVWLIVITCGNIFFLMTCEITLNFFKRDQRFSSKNAYDIIKNNLEAIWELPENERSQISVFKFILSRSSISRSSLNKVLKDLNDGGYINIHRGKLLNIKNLPLKY
ncbi:helix-turn-helix domain-containing protein [Enterobacter cloacae]|uniref:helix-turn-helix domain-containing protein n=1 Tax=Enterobacter cloacae TaxID=550 RepID=UPI003BF49F30